MKGKLPTTPATFDGDPSMGEGQVRYVSFCMNESVKTTRVMDCAYDEQIPTDDNGYYTIVIRRTEDRPKNAREQCGVAWIEWGPAGDGFEVPTSSTTTRGRTSTARAAVEPPSSEVTQRP